MLFVAGATLFSLSTQAYFIGAPSPPRPPSSTSRTCTCSLLLLPHALAELTALFLPLAAWLVASRRGDWASCSPRRL